MTRAQRLTRLEAPRIAELVTALHTELTTFRTVYDREHGQDPLDTILAPFSEGQVEVLCAAMEAITESGATSASTRLNVRDLDALVEAFRRFNQGQHL